MSFDISRLKNLEVNKYSKPYEEDRTKLPMNNTQNVNLPVSNQNKFLQFNEFNNANQNPLLSLAKTVTGTGTDILQDVAKGFISPIENVADVGVNALASVQDLMGFKNEAQDVRNFANRDLSGTISKRAAQSTLPGVAYNLFNGTPQNIINNAGVEIDTNKSFGENVGNAFNKIFNNDDTSNIEGYEKSSILGEYPDKLNELIGYTAGLSTYGNVLSGIGKTAEVAEKGSKAKDLINLGTKSLGVDANLGNIGVNIAGHTLNIPTLAFAGGMAGGLQEANSKENVNEWERWGKALSSGAIEGVTEGIFGLMGIGGSDITDKFASKLAGEFSTSAGKMLSKLGVQASGEAAEEFLSYVANYFVDNGIINKLGKGDFSSNFDLKELGEQMALAFVSAGISGGSTTVLGNNAATKSAEQQLGRPLTMQEKAQITQAVIDENVNERLQKLAKEQNQQILPTQNKNVAPNQTQNAQNQVQQQTTLPMQKMAQNQTSEQLPVSYKNQAENEIKNAKISENDKKMMLDVLNNLPEVSQKDLQDIKAQINQMTQIANETKPTKSFEDTIEEAMSNAEYNEPVSPLQDRNINTIGQQKNINAYQYDNPEVKPYYKQMAKMLMEDVDNISDKANRSTVKGGGTQLNTTTQAIKTLHNDLGYSYDDIRKGLNNIVEDHGAENNALSKKIELILDDQLRNGYRNSYGKLVDANADYINLINKGQTPKNQQVTENDYLTHAPNYYDGEQFDFNAHRTKITNELMNEVVDLVDNSTNLKEDLMNAYQQNENSEGNSNELNTGLDEDNRYRYQYKESVLSNFIDDLNNGKDVKSSELYKLMKENVSQIKQTQETKQEPVLLKDKEGNILKVYHGSPNSNISQFDSNMAGRNTQSDFTGIFFTDNPNIAEDFSYEQLPGNSNLSYKRGKKGSVYEKNLSYKNALNLNEINESNINQLEKYLDEKKLLGTKEETLNMMKQMANYNNAQGVKFYLDLNKIKNDYDLIIADMGGAYKGSNEYIVFDNSQIKDIEQKAESNLKQQQLDIIQKSNPMTDDYHTGIRDINDIKTFEEAMQDDESFVYGDFTRADAEKALKEGKVTVYSSTPIQQGSFVSTSQNMAKDYAGNGQIYSQEVNLDDVAWINGDEGQYAKINNTSNQTNTLENRAQDDDLLNADDSITEIKLPTQDNKQVLPTTKQNNLIEQSNKLSDKEVAKILTETQGKPKTKRSMMAFLKANLIDKGMVFEELSRKANNRDLQGKWDYTLFSPARASYAITKDRYVDGKKVSKSLSSIIDEVGEDTADFYKYMYNQLNIDRMTLEDRFGGDTGTNYERTKPIKNKPVFGESVTADISRNIVEQLEQQHPEFKEYAKDVYDYLDANTQELVDKGVISKDTQALFKEMYPHYVPISRVDTKGNAINVPLDTGRTGINNPIKRATGGSSDIQPMFNTIAERTQQVYRASARNSFGIELKNTLSTLNQLNEAVAQTDVDEIIDSMTTQEQNDELLKKGENGQNPTFTIFENGNKTTYEITEDMYDALKPKNELLKRLDDSKLSKGLTKFNNFRRGLLTEYNPVFMLTNSIKDQQDVLINSQHALKTYAKMPEAYAQILKKGTWYQEYMQNGGEQSSYFKDGEFEQKKNTLPSKVKEVVKMPLNAISSANNVIEMAPRLAEYIASREQGRSIETSMLDAARVTTNFKAGGDFTKTLNRNGATFLNASVQGFQQQIRNIQEANAKGLKGYAVLAAKYAIAGLPALLLNNLVWKDDEDYEQLQDYVKDNYYIIGKTPDGTFIRIPKGRAVATIQKIVSNVNDFIKDDKINSDDVGKAFWDDLKEDVSFAVDNLAPNNPLDNNIIAPITQAATNKTWYGSDLVPSRLKDKPAAEQYDETTDAISKWIGKTLNVSPVKVNYLLDQYSGGVGDVVLPMLTPQAENNAMEDKFTTNSTMKSKYPGEFFEKADELKVNNNSEKATDEDKLKYKYISNVQSEVSDLYKQKREIQNSSVSDTEKKKQLQDVQKQINDITKDALENVENIKISNDTAKIGDNEYYKYKDSWTKVTDKEKEKLNNVSLETYSDYKNSIEGLTSTKDKISTLMNQNISNKEKEQIYENFIGQNDNLYDTMKLAGTNINEYLKYKTQEFTSDKEDDGTTTGKTVSGSKKEKVVDYVQNMNITNDQKLLLLATQYSLTTAEKSKVANYVNSLKTTKANKLKIYESLSGFTVYKDGKVTWK